MSLVRIEQLFYAVGPKPLLDHIQATIEPGQRIAIIGRNGEGKSTLLKLIANDLSADGGECIIKQGIKVARLSQALPEKNNQSVYDFVTEGLAPLKEKIKAYEALVEQPDGHDEAWFEALATLQSDIEAANGFDWPQQVDKVISKLSLPAKATMGSLSGGWRRRAALAKALVTAPDLLLLDEPTNHLDIEAIQWLEQFLASYDKTLVFITHDRNLLSAVATDIWEIDRGQLTVFAPPYDAYLKRKEKILEDEKRHNALFDKKLAEEEVWIRQGIKARRTRNEGRVRALEKLRETRKERIDIKNKPTFDVNIDQEKRAKTVISAENITFGYDGKPPLIKDFSFNVQKGDKLILIGPNGVGKTTLIKLLLSVMPPNSGEVKSSPKNQVAYFEQTRDSLDPNIPAMENVAEGDDFVTINGKSKHLIGYLSEFMFTPEKCRTQTGVLSGGEQNRLLLAKLFSKPANILVLDEPTNDLDIESLEILADRLASFPGVVILISHDRYFIDSVATHTLIFKDNGHIEVNVGGYQDWLRLNANQKTTPGTKSSTQTKEPTAKKSKSNTNANKPVKLTYKEQQQLKNLPEQCEALELEISALQSLMGTNEFFKESAETVKEKTTELNRLENELNELFGVWEALEAKQQGK